MEKVLIIITGGRISQVLASSDITVQVIDNDLEDPFMHTDQNAVDIVTDGAPFYESFTDVTDPQGMWIRDELKRRKL